MTSPTAACNREHTNSNFAKAESRQLDTFRGKLTACSRIALLAVATFGLLLVTNAVNGQSVLAYSANVTPPVSRPFPPRYTAPTGNMPTKSELASASAQSIRPLPGARSVVSPTVSTPTSLFQSRHASHALQGRAVRPLSSLDPTQVTPTLIPPAPAATQHRTPSSPGHIITPDYAYAPKSPQAPPALFDPPKLVIPVSDSTSTASNDPLPNSVTPRPPLPDSGANVFDLPLASNSTRDNASLPSGYRSDNPFYREPSPRPPIHVDFTSSENNQFDRATDPILHANPVPSMISGSGHNSSELLRSRSTSVSQTGRIRSSQIPTFARGVPYTDMPGLIGSEHRFTSDTTGNWDGYDDEFIGINRPWKLIPNTCGGFNFDFWLDAGGYSNGAGDSITRQWSTVEHNNGFVVNQLWMRADKQAKTDGCGVDWGAHVDFMFGTDASVMASADWDSDWYISKDIEGQPLYGLAMPQIYGELAYNNFSARVGQFFSVLGYECVPAVENVFYSHGNLFTYAEPRTHTGVMVDYNGAERLTLSGGYVMGWNSGFSNPGDAGMLLGFIGYELLPELSMSYAINAGYLGTSNGTMYMHTFTISYDIMPDVHYLIYNDLAYNANVTNPNQLMNLNVPVASRADLDWGGVGQFLVVDFSEKYSGGVRVEWFNDPDGRTSVATKGQYWNLTGGISYRPIPNVTFRSELRYDWFNGTGLPYNDHMSKDIFGGGMDVVVTW